MIARTLGVLSLALGACAQTALMPLSEVRAGMKGTGKTVFSGTRIEEFQVEVLGVLENTGPKQSIILGRLSGGPLAHSGVLQGMSGSPVYVNGWLIGAVATAFAFSKDPIAGIRPIEEMLRRPPPEPRRAWSGGTVDLAAQLPAAAEYSAGGSRMVDIATPLSMSGFTAGTVRHFAAELRKLGLEPMQGASGGGRTGAAPGDPRMLVPGSMISVQLVTGDLSVGADGTVTHVGQGKVYAFGHRFLGVGAVEMPFARSEVLTLLPNVNTSFKIASSREWMGAITHDHNAAVAGAVGRRAPMIPVSITVNGDQRARYEMQVVRDSLLAPFLLQMATYSAIDGTERTAGASTITAKGVIEFQGAAPVRIDTIYSADNGAPLLASLSGALPLSYAMQSGFPELAVRRVQLDLSASEEKRAYQVGDVWPSRGRVRPGETVRIHVSLNGPRGQVVKREADWTVPVGLAEGPLNFTVSDAMITNLVEHQHELLQPPASFAQARELLDTLIPNNVVSVRVWRAAPVFQAQGKLLPAPPPSVANILKRSNSAAAGVPAAWGVKLGEVRFRLDGGVVSGSKSVQVEVKD